MVQPLSSAQGAIQFQYLAEIAVGTTARVDLCRATSPPHLAGKLLAVKRLHQHIAEDPAFANQFHDEVWMTAALKHPNVVEVAGWGQDDDGMYLAVELVQGVSLARLMKTIFDTGEAFTERMVVYIASRLCRGLAAAHGLRAQNGELLQLVHRDLTPGNVLVGFNGDVKITDFGLAKAKQRLTKTLTGLLKGQPAYMAPEQARGNHIDHRTDLFALGVMMFELFAGRKPWLAASDFDAVQAILTKPPDDLRDVRAKIDRELAAVVQRCLEKDPAARFQSASEVQARLDEWLLVHGYQEGNEEALSRFVRRNAMRQMRWFERAVKGDLIEGRPEPPKASAYTGQNPKVNFDADDDDDGDEESTDLTDVEQMVHEMHQRASDPRAARRIVEEGDYSEEVPTIVQKSGALPIRPKQGAPAPAAAQPRPAAGQPPRVPARPPAPPAHGARPPPPAPQQRPAQPPPSPQPSPRPPAAQQPPASPQPPAQQPSAATRPTRPDGRVAVPNARAMHESIIDEDSDARTTAVKARPRAGQRATPPLILPPMRDSMESINDSESEEVPTLPIQGLPASARSSRGAAPRALPGQIAPPDPRAPQPPPSYPSLQSVEDDWGPRGPVTEERLFAEADRLALEAVRLGDEAKAAAARAERQAMLSKIAADAAAIAVEAVRLAGSAGIAEAARRLEDAYALERTIRRLAATPLDVPASAATPPPGSGSPRVHTAPLPAASSPGMGAPSQPDPRSSHQQPAMGQPAPTSSFPRAIPPTTIPMPHAMRPDSSSMIPPPPNPHTSGAMEAFEARLRPTIFGLPSLHVAALAIGTFILVLILMWIILG